MHVAGQMVLTHYLISFFEFVLQVRIARLLQLHRDPDHLAVGRVPIDTFSVPGAQLDSKLVQRIFWSIVVKDVHRHWQQLLPPLLKENDTDVAPPQWRARRTQDYFTLVSGARDMGSLKEAETTAPPPRFDHTEALWLEFLLRLTLLTRRGATQMATTKATHTGCLPTAVKGYISGIERWLSTLPKALRWESITAGHTD